MSKPLTLPRWATGGGANIVDPPSGKKDDGWVAAEAPADGYWNWFNNLVYQWAIWLDAFESTAHTWTAAQTYTVGAIFQAGITVTQSTANGRAGLFTGNGTGVGLRSIGGSGGAYGVEGQGTTFWGGGFFTGGPSDGDGVGGLGVGAGRGGTFNGGNSGGHGAIATGGTGGSGIFGLAGTGGAYGGSFDGGVGGLGVYAVTNSNLFTVASIKGESSGSAAGVWARAFTGANSRGFQGTIQPTSPSTARALMLYKETAALPGTPDLSYTGILGEVAGALKFTGANPVKTVATLNSATGLNLLKAAINYTSNNTANPTFNDGASMQAPTESDVGGFAETVILFAQPMADALYNVQMTYEGGIPVASLISRGMNTPPIPEIKPGTKTVNGFTLQYVACITITVGADIAPSAAHLAQAKIVDATFGITVHGRQ